MVNTENSKRMPCKICFRVFCSIDCLVSSACKAADSLRFQYNNFVPTFDNGLNELSGHIYEPNFEIVSIQSLLGLYMCDSWHYNLYYI